MNYYTRYEKYIVFLLRVALGGMFVYSGFTKLQQPMTFLTIVREYGMLPEILIVPFASLLPWTEILLGAAMILGILKRMTSYAMLLMLLMFIIAVSYQIITGNTGDCGCGVGLLEENFTQVLIRDFVMFAATVLVARSDTEFLEIWNRKLY